ncbi:hypothetical protein NC661_08110 [Aquibacillus koreensis]|uniref:Inner spore coat protein n=1 Tax=Aquibacillus koreensis TaxID=279446 RepID=A0A9X3WI06_9BACI|nr:hypothetical protein [Aquibacillus koreensis]MCT2535871.1 hypothetical protein [Aquibacillus koreensis]MDC3420327.1 hypothetical protein [Aquibacillus koreensis]
MLYPIQYTYTQQPYYGYYAPVRYPYPEVNTQQLKMSAKALRPLMQDANNILESFSSSEDFAYKVMDAAQKSETDNIKTYIRELGITRDVEIKYNPDSIQLRLVNQTNQIDCCKLSISLHW